MKKGNLVSLLLLLFAGCSSPEQQTERSPETPPSTEQFAHQDHLTIVFYNTENLFHPSDEPGKEDKAFTPEGQNQWTQERYRKKCTHIGRVLHAIDPDTLPDLIGLCEVENQQVLQDLARTSHLQQAEYTILHHEGPDPRGIDVALLYKDNLFSPIQTVFHEVDLPGTSRPTREILYSKGVTTGKDTLHLFVTHWPSRAGGKERSAPHRMHVAETLREQVSSIRQNAPKAKILIMGDLNDHPGDPSLIKGLRARPLQDSSYLSDLFFQAHQQGKGTYNYQDNWGVLDHFILSRPLLDAQNKLDASLSQASIFKQSWMLYHDEESDQHKPSRFIRYGNFYGGYSDHLPIRLNIKVKPYTSLP